jgi:hypothetical protein
LPTEYRGGVQVDLDILPEKMETFIKIKSKDRIEYFNNEKINKMKIGKTNVILFLDVEHISLVYVATEESSSNAKLKHYSIQFKRISLLQM